MMGRSAQKFKYICDAEAFEDDSVSTFNYFVSVKTLTGNFPCTGDIQLTSRSEGRCTYLDKIKISHMALNSVLLTGTRLYTDMAPMSVFLKF